MELVNCPNCNRTLLSSAKKCLECGRSMKSQPQATTYRRRRQAFMSLIAKIKIWWRRKKQYER